MSAVIEACELNPKEGEFDQKGDIAGQLHGIARVDGGRAEQTAALPGLLTNRAPLLNFPVSTI